METSTGQPTGQTDSIKKKIVQAAAERFSHYGYGKTNVAEIARDCGMSPGNLYRYFKNKLEIAEVIMRMAMERVLAELRSVLGAEELTATQRLEEYILQELYFTHHQLDMYPTLVEQVRDETGQGPMLASEYYTRSRELLAEILSAGMKSGEFAADDPEETARRIQDATHKFRYPQLHSKESLAELEDRARGVIDLIEKSLTPVDAKTAH